LHPVSVAELPSVGSISMPPDPGVLAAIGLNHRFESAVADLVDNSIDARASTVLIRFVLSDGLLSSLLVVDDGDGMDEGQITNAMQLGRAKENASSSLGHFGVGLKSATFSQASVLTVLSRRNGRDAQGRRMQRDSKGRGFECELLDSTGVEAVMDDLALRLNFRPSTVVNWDDVRTFPASADRQVTNVFLEKQQANLRYWLGLTFHRLIENQRVRVLIDCFDSDLGESGFVFEVDAIDPFGYARSGAAAYPKAMTAVVEQRTISIDCHIWPAGSDSAAFRLNAGHPDSGQGFYLYRNDRLLSAGKWGGVTHEHRRRRLARASIDIEAHLDLFIMSAEKSSVLMTPDLVRAIELATAMDGTTFSDYIEEAETTFQTANRRSRTRSAVLPPGQGIPPAVKRALGRELDFLEAEDPLRIRWTSMQDGDFVDVDRETRTLWLNAAYRESVLKGGHGGVNDAPLIKALLFLLFEDIFRGKSYGPKDKDNVALWQEVLAAAAEAEYRDFSG
jgi:hypothetical protein